MEVQVTVLAAIYTKKQTKNQNQKQGHPEKIKTKIRGRSFVPLIQRLRNR